MINVTKHPDKVIAAISAPFSQYFIVVDSETGQPQHFFWNAHRTESLGEFMPSEEGEPITICDRETALYLIGQSAVSSFLNFDVSTTEGQFMKAYKSPGYHLLPVHGSMFTRSSTLNPEK